MSDSNAIFAIAQGEQVSGTSYNGSTWVEKSLPTHQQWNFIGGNDGKFVFNVWDGTERYSTKAIAYDTEWNIGLLPSNITSCVVAYCNEDEFPATSFDGDTFGNLRSNTYYVTGFAKVRNNTRCNLSQRVIAMAVSTSRGETRKMTLKTMTRVVNSIVSTITEFIW
jgi:hypothetical protein